MAGQTTQLETTHGESNGIRWSTRNSVEDTFCMTSRDYRAGYRRRKAVWWWFRGQPDVVISGYTGGVAGQDAVRRGGT